MKQEPESQDAWEQLASKAQQHQPSEDDQAPFGFATRVAALGLEARQKTVEVSLFALERYWLRGLVVAGVIAAVTFLAGFEQIGELADLTSSLEVQLISSGESW